LYGNIDQLNDLNNRIKLQLKTLKNVRS